MLGVKENNDKIQEPYNKWPKINITLKLKLQTISIQRTFHTE